MKRFVNLLMQGSSDQDILSGTVVCAALVMDRQSRRLLSRGLQKEQARSNLGGALAGEE